MTQPPQTHHDTPARQEPPPAAQPGERRTLVGAGMTLAALLFIGAGGLLYLRWATMREPMCLLIIHASAALRGAEVTVDGVGLPKPHVATIGIGERFSIPFYLDYGTYSVQVAMDPEQEPFVNTEVTLTRENPGRRLDLSTVTPPPPSPRSPSTAPTTMPLSPMWMPSDATRDLPTLTPPPGGGSFAP